MTSTKIKEKNLKAWCIDRDDLINSTEVIFWHTFHYTIHTYRWEKWKEKE
jgi:hypothetical protein